MPTPLKLTARHWEAMVKCEEREALSKIAWNRYQKARSHTKFCVEVVQNSDRLSAVFSSSIASCVEQESEAFELAISAYKEAMKARDELDAHRRFAGESIVDAAAGN